MEVDVGTLNERGTNMKQQLINEIEQSMLRYLDNSQLEGLRNTLHRVFEGISITKEIEIQYEFTNEELEEKFLAAKNIEGCSNKTLHYYRSTLNKMLSLTTKHITHMTTDDLRSYLATYQENSKCSRTNIDNIRRIISSFFSWLEEENYIMKSPMRRIHRIKTDQTVKETYSDEALEVLRDNTTNLRDLALIDLLASTGMRVGELVKLNISDIDFENRECIVFGKGSKERPVYFDARTKIHLKNYIQSRTDENSALFVSLNKPFNRLNISGVEIRLRELGRSLGINKVHPHKFRRTLATRAIDKGMPIEQVQKLLGHSKIDTTMHYAMVNQNNVKQSHRKYIS